VGKVCNELPITLCEVYVTTVGSAILQGTCTTTIGDQFPELNQLSIGVNNFSQNTLAV